MRKLLITKSLALSFGACAALPALSAEMSPDVHLMNFTPDPQASAGVYETMFDPAFSAMSVADFLDADPAHLLTMKIGFEVPAEELAPPVVFAVVDPDPAKAKPPSAATGSEIYDLGLLFGFDHVPID